MKLNAKDLERVEKQRAKLEQKLARVQGRDIGQKQQCTDGKQSQHDGGKH